MIGEKFLFGVGAVGAILLALGVAGVPLVLVVMVVVVVAVTAALMLRRESSERPRFRWAATAVMLVPFAVVFIDVLVLPLRDWDGLITWMPKARAIAIEGSIYAPFFRGVAGLNLHNHYPLLLPLDAAVMLRLFGETGVRVLYASIPLALLLMLRVRLVPICGEHVSAWITAVAAWIPLVTIGYGSATSAYADLAVAAFSGVALLAILQGRDCGPWLAFLILTKNEGMMLGLALLATAILMRAFRWRFLIGPAIAVTLLSVWRSIVPDAYDERNAVLLRELPQRLGRIDDAALALLQYTWTWGLIWPVAAIALFLAVRAPGQRRSAVGAALYLALGLTGYTLVLSVTSWNIDELARVAAERLLLHFLVPVCVLLAAGWAAVATRPPAPPRTA